MKTTLANCLAAARASGVLLGLVLLALWILAACSQAAPSSPATGSPTRAVESQAPDLPAEPETLAPPAGGSETRAALETALPDTGQAGPSPVAGTDTDSLDCIPPTALTPAMTEGPYYMEGSPERTSFLEDDPDGTRILIQGYVLTQDCEPVPGAWLDFWQTNHLGEYDNAGYVMRGHQFTDEAGRYRLETVIPGEYPGRTAHIHVKVQAPGGPVLTSQLFIPGAPGNESDRIFSEALLLAISESADGLEGAFNFVVAAP